MLEHIIYSFQNKQPLDIPYNYTQSEKEVNNP